MSGNNCQCEHEKHFQEFSGAHTYGQSVTRTEAVQTTMGTFHVCTECANTCYGPNSGVRAA